MVLLALLLALSLIFSGCSAQCTQPNTVPALTSCETSCEPSCLNPFPPSFCPPCTMRTCNCRPGYVRDRFGNCVLYQNCPRFSSPTTTTRRTTTHRITTLRTTTRRITFPPLTCASIRCLWPYVCVMRPTIPCFRPPCPPTPRCVLWWQQWWPFREAEKLATTEQPDAQD